MSMRAFLATPKPCPLLALLALLARWPRPMIEDLRRFVSVARIEVSTSANLPISTAPASTSQTAGGAV